MSFDSECLVQEWLMRRLALCQCCLALQLLRAGGNFVCKLFDIFTPFVSDLCYLMSLAFERTCLCKPLTSRPANSERYLVCLGLSARRGGALADYMLHVNQMLDAYPDPPGPPAKQPDKIHTITRLAAAVPDAWVAYVKNHNVHVGEVQVQFLDETLKFYQDPQLNIDAQQAAVCARLRTEWGIPETVQESRNIFLGDPHRAPTAASSHAASLGRPHLFCFDRAVDLPPKIAPPAAAQGIGAGFLSAATDGSAASAGAGGGSAGGGGRWHGSWRRAGRRWDRAACE